ncbi:hypothetical protein [Algiphilus sp.]|uniref:hypothetical protein n=1 Tax=Algiphilus sp. TaxID=1872431 RepID=UPI003C3134C3
MVRLMALALASSLGACAITPAPQPVIDDHAGSAPGGEEAHSTMVGDVMLTTYAYRAQRFAVLREPLPAITPDGEDEGVMAYLFGDGDKVAPLDRLEPGTRLPLSETHEGARAFCQRRRCVRDADGDGTLDSEFIVSAKEGAVEVREGLRVPYAIEDDVAESRESVKRDLVYQGRGSDTIKVAYREFQDGRFARPAFFQELSYQLAEEGPTSIGFRSARIEVLEASNTEIRYRVLSGLQ